VAAATLLRLKKAFLAKNRMVVNMKHLYWLIFLISVISSCSSSDKKSSSADDSEILAALDFPIQMAVASKGNVRPVQSFATYNKESPIPPQCYTKHENEFNPCMTCHQTYPTQ
jgi:hypothetical protein